MPCIHPPRTRNHTLRGAADTHQHVHWGASLGNLDRSSNVAVGDEANTSPSLPNLPNHISVTGSVQDQDGDITVGMGNRSMRFGFRTEVESGAFAYFCIQTAFGLHDLVVGHVHAADGMLCVILHLL